MLRRLLYSLIPLVVLLIGAEFALRSAGWPKKDTSKQFAHAQVFWVSDPSLNKESFPHKETGGSFRVSTDANGLRVPLHSEEKTDGMFRVMTLGCSTTFGWGVNDEESYPARLEAILQQQGHKVEVINGGQPGHTSFQGLWLWEKTLHRYKPDLVIFGYIVQDSRSVAYTDRSQAILQNNGDFLKQNFLYNFKVYLGLRELIDSWRIRSKETASKEQAVNRVPVDEYAENMRTFKQKIESNGGKMMLFGYPLEQTGYTAQHREVLAAASDVLKVPLHDPQKEMTKLASQQTLYFPQDRGHANAQGNDIIAQGVAQFLVAQQLVP